MKRRYAILETTPPQSVSKNITCTSARIRGGSISDFKLEISDLRLVHRDAQPEPVSRYSTAVLQKFFGLFVQLRGGLPHRQILKACLGHERESGISSLKFQI